MPTSFSNGADLKSQRIQNLGNASAPTDAVTLQQVQDYLSGLDLKDPARVATTGAITLSGTQTIDGIAVAAGDRVLVKNQASQPTNGIYVVAAGAWVRSADADVNSEVTAGLAVAVLEGTTKGTGTAVASPMLYTLTNIGAITLGTTALNFAVFGGGGVTYSAGNGLALNGTAFSVTPAAGGGISVAAGGVSVDATIPRKFSGNIGDGSLTSIVVTHNLGTLDVDITLVEVATGAEWIADVSTRTTTSVTLAFATAPATNAFRVTVIG